MNLCDPWVEQVYGIPPEQVVGSSIKTKFEVRDGSPVIVRLPEIDFIDDKAGKPVAIHKFIGRAPDRCLWKFRWRSSNVAMDRCR